MSEISNYEAQKKKLQGLCDEHNFTFRFFKDRYPITLVITPINDVATQMDMLGNVEETGYCSQDSSMCWIPILRGIPSRTPSRRPRRTTPTMNRPRTPLRTIRRNNRWQRQRQCEISGTTTKKHS